MNCDNNVSENYDSDQLQATADVQMQIQDCMVDENELPEQDTDHDDCDSTSSEHLSTYIII